MSRAAIAACACSQQSIGDVRACAACISADRSTTAANSTAVVNNYNCESVVAVALRCFRTRNLLTLLLLASLRRFVYFGRPRDRYWHDPSRSIYFDSVPFPTPIRTKLDPIRCERSFRESRHLRSQRHDDNFYCARSVFGSQWSVGHCSRQRRFGRSI